MTTTRRTLIAQNNELSQRLASTMHVSRTQRIARMRAAEALVEELQAQVADLTAKLKASQDLNEELRSAVVELKKQAETQPV